MSVTTELSASQDPRNLRCPHCSERLGDVSDCDEQMTVDCDACGEEIHVSKTLGSRWLAVWFPPTATATTKEP